MLCREVFIQSYVLVSILGVCISGDFHSPHHEQVCSEAIITKHNKTGDATWSFRECPDLLECSLGRDNCVENAVCNETLDSFECHCERGYTGVGDELCEKTCYHSCEPHGVCEELSSANTNTTG